MSQVKLLRQAKLLMIIGGVWRMPLFSKPQWQKLYQFGAYLLQTLYILVVFFMFIEFFFLLNHEDVKKLTDNIQITITCSLACVKGLIFQSGRFPKLIQYMINEEKEMLKSEDEEINKIYLGCVKYIEKCATAIIVLAGGTAGLLVVATSIIGLMTGNDEKPMIFLAHFPFDQQKYYKISLSMQAASIAIATIYYCMSQILYLSILTFAKAKLQMLQIYFSSFRCDQGSSSFAIVRRLIQLHQDIINFVQDLNNSIKYLLLIEFLLSSLNIASVTYQFISAQAIADLLFSFSYLIVLIGQLFILAWHANEVKVESIAISDAVYESCWYNTNIETRKLLHMVILRAQKPLLLTIGPFNPLTTQTVISVINAAYSYVMIMTNNN